MQHILSLTVVQKVQVVYRLFTLWWLTGTSCLKNLVFGYSGVQILMVMTALAVRQRYVWSAVKCFALKATAARLKWEVTQSARVLRMPRSVVQGSVCFYACVNVRSCWWPIRREDAFTPLLIWMHTARQTREWGNDKGIFRELLLRRFPKIARGPPKILKLSRRLPKTSEDNPNSSEDCRRWPKDFRKSPDVLRRFSVHLKTSVIFYSAPCDCL